MVWNCCHDRLGASSDGLLEQAGTRHMLQQEQQQVPTTPWTGSSESVVTEHSYKGLSRTIYGACSPDPSLGKAFPGVGVTRVSRRQK